MRMSRLFADVKICHFCHFLPLFYKVSLYSLHGDYFVILGQNLAFLADFGILLSPSSSLVVLSGCILHPSFPPL